ncbi:MFS transporter [Halochromatium salexigens]|uniref:MFS transporter n=1 Tax=Halochromatium salexigens TaxID=49447 RepID=A0AAJ0XGN1_HALSE|nr:MFS transporter [Halochromatium salexigens]MBK5932279.1 MFS transporter [Halochromatium salexigens]
MHPLLRHWRFLSVGFLLVAFSAVGQTFVLSLFGGEWRATFGLSHGGLGLAYSAATLLSALLLIAAGHLVDRVALPLMVAGVVLGAALGSVALALSVGVPGLVLGFFLLRFFGQGLMAHTAQTAVARAFRQHRGKAVSLVAAGFPVAEAIAPILVVALAAALGWRTTWWLIAGLLILLAAVLLALLGRHFPGRPSLEVDSSDEPAPWTRAQVLRDRRFYLILPALMGAPFIATAVFFHQVPLAESKGWTLAWLAASFPAFAAAHLVSLSFSGPLIDRFGARRLLPWHLTPFLLALSALALTDGDWLAPLYLGLAGLGMGLANSLMGVIWVELYGSTHLGAIRALAQSAMIFSTAVAPVSVGLLLDGGWSMARVAVLLAGMVMLASVLAWQGLRR